MPRIVFEYSDPPTEADQRGLSQAMLDLSRLAPDLKRDGSGYIYLESNFIPGQEIDSIEDGFEDTFMEISVWYWIGECVENELHMDFFPDGRARMNADRCRSLTWAAAIYMILGYAHKYANLDHDQEKVNTILQFMRGQISDCADT